MTMKTIEWDFDEVLAKLREVVCNHVSPILGIHDNDWRNWMHYDLGLSHQFSQHQIHNALIRTEALELAAFDPEARRLLLYTHLMGFKNIIVTARGWHPYANFITWDWLITAGVNLYVEDVIVVPYGEDKYPVIAKLPNVKLYVDDLSYHCQLVKQYCRVPDIVLVDRPWNQTAEAFIRITSMRDLIPILHKHI